MSRVESLKEKIGQIEGRLRFFRNALLAILSGLVWVVYTLIEGRSGVEAMVLGGVGLAVALVVFIRIKSLEIEQDWLIEELEKE